MSTAPPAFPVEAAENILRRVITDTLGKGSAKYSPEFAARILDSIVSASLAALSVSIPNCKFFVNATMHEKVGAGFHNISGALWNTETDGYISVPFENKSFYLLITCCGLPTTVAAPSLTNDLEDFDPR